MNPLPFWALSPSPFTLAFYAILTLWGTMTLRYTVKSKWAAFRHAALLLVFLVGVTDCLWVVVCGLRFGVFFPGSVLQLLLAGARDLAVVVFVLMLIGDKIRFSRNAKFWLLLNVAFLGVWFLLSPTPAFTDWTFALKYDYPLTTVAVSFGMSHILGRLIVVFIYGNLLLNMRIAFWRQQGFCAAPPLSFHWKQNFKSKPAYTLRHIYAGVCVGQKGNSHSGGFPRCPYGVSNPFLKLLFTPLDFHSTTAGAQTWQVNKISQQVKLTR